MRKGGREGGREREREGEMKEGEMTDSTQMLTMGVDGCAWVCMGVDADHLLYLMLPLLKCHRRHKQHHSTERTK